ncbi:hypothetical protein FMEXI_13846 [Fusarium mexicanum]|uniref:BTB domain-containing protein n=1 Tax=Fusarium mexicanum TaxID=751941 RepID=A0A8H5I5L9_9HYPO|nr:hypothetical protein FMEXI_13846 [Fusarium mexicanum]
MATIPPPPHSPTRFTRARAAQETAGQIHPHQLRENAAVQHLTLLQVMNTETTIMTTSRNLKEFLFMPHWQPLFTSPFFDKAMSGDYKESTSRSIELPEDDPDVVERFLEFLYTGNYSDGTNFTWGNPSKAALLDPETVIQNLQQPACGSQEMDMLSTVEGSDEWVTDDEPDEEYNDYDDRTGSPSDKGDVDEQSKLTKVTEAVGEGRCSREEGLKQLAELRNDMTLPLRLYVMADKYL